MVLETMYPAAVNSPVTTTQGALSPSATQVTVLSGAVLPEAPNLLVIGGDTSSAETVLMTEKSGDTLTIQRAVQGVARTWPAGTQVARLMTAYDHDTFKANIEMLDGQIDGITQKLWNPNILVNADFGNPVNTKGQKSYTSGGTGYAPSFDKWLVRGASAVQTLEDGYITLSAPTSYGFLEQRIEHPEIYSEKTLTLSALVRNPGLDLPSLNIVDGDASKHGTVYVPVNMDWAIVSVTYDAPPNLSGLTVYFYAGAASNVTVDIAAVKLEIGSVSTIANDPSADYNVEFLRSTVASPTQSNPNILHNWDFRNPVNQLFQTVYTAAGYTIDRWWVTSQGTTMTLNSEFITFVHPNGDNSIRQNIESPQKYLGKVVTLSCRIRRRTTADIIVSLNGSSTQCYVYATALGEWEDISCTCTINNTTNLHARIYWYEGADFDVESIKLEPGEVSTLLNDSLVDNGKELAVCQRYQFNPFYPPVSGQGYLCFNLIATSATVAYGLVETPVTMRVLPMLNYNPANYKLSGLFDDGFTIYHSITSMQVYGKTAHGIMIRVYISSGVSQFVLGNMYVLVADNQLNETILFDANM